MSFFGDVVCIILATTISQRQCLWHSKARYICAWLLMWVEQVWLLSQLHRISVNGRKSTQLVVTHVHENACIHTWWTKLHWGGWMVFAIETWQASVMRWTKHNEPHKTEKNWSFASQRVTSTTTAFVKCSATSCTIYLYPMVVYISQVTNGHNQCTTLQYHS